MRQLGFILVRSFLQLYTFSTLAAPMLGGAMLRVEEDSMGFQGPVLSLSEGDEAKLALLKPLLEKLPWEKGSLKLGSTFEEMGRPTQIARISCVPYYRVYWQDKQLNIAGDDGGPGDGKVFTDVWNSFDTVARPMYSFEQPKLKETLVELVREDAVLVADLEQPKVKTKLVDLVREDAVLVADLPLLEVVVSSMGFNGSVLSLGPTALEKLSPLEPLLEKLPWNKGSLKLGKTLAEMGYPDTILERSCPTFYTLNWRGKRLQVEEETGAPGDGQVFIDAWDRFDAAARPMYKFEEPGACLVMEERLRRFEELEALEEAELIPDAPVEIAELLLLEVSVSSMGFDGPVLSIGDNMLLAPLEPLLEKLPWSKGSLKLGKTRAEMGNPDTFLERSCATSYTLNWRGKRLEVEEETGAPGDGQVFIDAWNKFDEAARPMYKFEKPKLETIEVVLR